MLRASLPATLTVDTRLAAGDATLLTDPTEIQQVLINLCNNAAQAMAHEGGILTAVEQAPAVCRPVRWGKRLAAVGVTLAGVEPDELRELLEDAWEGKAPARLVEG